MTYQMAVKEQDRHKQKLWSPTVLTETQKKMDHKKGLVIPEIPFFWQPMSRMLMENYMRMTDSWKDVQSKKKTQGSSK